MPRKTKAKQRFDVILADRDPRVRSALRLLLDEYKRAGTIAEASDANQVIACIAKSCPDLLLVDWDLPGQATSSLLFIIKMICPKLFIIVLSEQPGDCKEALMAGADEYVCKCDPPDLLMALIDDVLLAKDELPQGEMVRVWE